MSVALVSANTDLNARIALFVKTADEKVADHWKQSGYTFSPPPIHEALYTSDKWVKVVTKEHRGGKYETSSVYAFIALQDYTTKGLGAVKAGDIHKAATFKAPAKHARGNVFREDFANALTAYGIVYLK